MKQKLVKQLFQNFWLKTSLFFSHKKTTNFFPCIVSQKQGLFSRFETSCFKTSENIFLYHLEFRSNSKQSLCMTSCALPWDTATSFFANFLWKRGREIKKELDIWMKYQKIKKLNSTMKLKLFKQLCQTFDWKPRFFSHQKKTLRHFLMKQHLFSDTRSSPKNTTGFSRMQTPKTARTCTYWKKK